MRAALLPILLLAGACGEGPPRTVLLVTVDTLRADHTSAFGYDLPTTPALAALAEEGTAFGRCLSQHPETGPSISSILTSRYPRETGVRENGALLPPEFPTLAERFHEAGYRTAAFVSTYLLKPHACGLQRGFQVYDHEMTARNLGHDAFERPAGETVERARQWLEETRGERRFLWVHLYDPHGRYDPGEEYAVLFRREIGRGEIGRSALDPAEILPYQRFGDSRDPDDYVARYDGEIRRSDEALAPLYGAVGDGALVVSTADHGEGLGEEGYWFRHGSRLDRAALHVPLVFRGPGIPAGRRVRRLVRSIDIAPTVLDLSGLEPLPMARGSSLRPSFEGGPPSEPRTAFAEARRMGGVADRTGVNTDYKVYAARGASRVVLNLEKGIPQVAVVPGVTDLHHALVDWLGIGDRLPGDRPAGEVDEALRTLGYIR